MSSFHSCPFFSLYNCCNVWPSSRISSFQPRSGVVPPYYRSSQVLFTKPSIIQLIQSREISKFLSCSEIYQVLPLHSCWCRNFTAPRILSFVFSFWNERKTDVNFNLSSLQTCIRSRRHTANCKRATHIGCRTHRQSARWLVQHLGYASDHPWW